MSNLLFTFISLNFLILIFSLQFDTHIISSSNHIQTKLRQLYQINTDNDYSVYNIMTIKVCFGIPNQCFNLLYDTGMMYTLIGDITTKAQFKNRFNCSSSLSYRAFNEKLFPIPYRTGIIFAREVSDYAVFEHQNHSSGNTFNFLIGFNTSVKYDFDGILGFGYLYPKENEKDYFDIRFSFLDYMVRNKFISKKAFGHEYINSTHGIFYLGEMPSIMKEGSHKCKISSFIPYLTKWHCKLRDIKFANGEKVDIPVTSAAFDTGAYDIKAPINDGQILFEKIRSISKGLCTIIERQINENVIYKKLLCNITLNLRIIPSINFYLDTFSLKLRNCDMFRRIIIDNEEKFIFVIVLDSRNNYWNLGQPILKNYNMFFDSDEGNIMFKENIDHHEESITTISILFIILIILIFISKWVYDNRRIIFTNKLDFKSLKHFQKENLFNSGDQLNDVKEEN